MTDHAEAVSADHAAATHRKRRTDADPVILLCEEAGEKIAHDAIWNMEDLMFQMCVGWLGAMTIRDKRGFPRPVAPGKYLARDVIKWVRKGPPKPPRTNVATILYRHFDKQGRLLYVGISLGVLHRTSRHKAGSSWFDQIATITLEHFPNKANASAAEKRAIRDECPAHNRLHVGKNAAHADT